MRAARKLFSALVVVVASRLSAQVAEPKWGPAPPIFPAGAKMAVMQGDPSKAEPFTIRLDLPEGYKIPPHTHPTDEHVTVLKGVFLVGMGEKFDTSKMMPVAVDGFVTAPAKMNHYARAQGHTMVQVTAMGPFAMTYANPADDPTRKR